MRAQHGLSGRSGEPPGVLPSWVRGTQAQRNAGGIPKRIIQTAKSRELPLTEKAAVGTVRSLNPDYEYMFFDDLQVDAFIAAQDRMHQQAFRSFRIPIQRYDFFRYLAIYQFGGFYFDTDVLLASGVDALLQHDCVFPYEELTLYAFLREECGMDWEIGNYAFGAAPGHPFIERIIENCHRAQRDPAWAQQMLGSIPALFQRDFLVFCTTGPGLISRTLAEYGDASASVTVLFPGDVCDSGTWHQFGEYGVHAMQGSWLRKGSLLRQRLLMLWRARERRIALKAARRRGPTRSLQFRCGDGARVQSNATRRSES
jgi:hypothetical protein